MIKYTDKQDIFTVTIEDQNSFLKNNNTITVSVSNITQTSAVKNEIVENRKNIPPIYILKEISN